MKRVGIEEFKTHSSLILRSVRDDGETIEITYRGEVFATVTPVTPIPRSTPRTKEEIERRFAALEELAQEISRRWPEGVSAVDAIRADRRDVSDLFNAPRKAGEPTQ